MRFARSIALALALVSACTGRIGDPPGPAQQMPRDPNDPNDPKDPNDPNNPPPPPPPPELPSPAPRYLRLTNGQWAASVRDVLQLDAAPPIDQLPADVAQGGFLFDTGAGALGVDQVTWSAFGRAAQQIANDVAGDAAQLARILPPSSDPDDDRARDLIRRIGERAHRRPLDAMQLEAYFTVFDTGRDNGTFEDGIALFIEALLQAPLFLYRVELAETAADGVIPLDGYERATRLSYFLWGSIPDDALRTAARDGLLDTPAGLLTETRRMLADDRASATIARFHRQLFDEARVAAIAPASSVYSGGRSLAAAASAEQDAFVSAVFAEEGGLTTLLTSNETFVNRELAELYGLEGTFDDTFTRVTLDRSERRGIFTRIAFLAGHATPTEPDPIHRGVMLSRRIACNPLPAPPDNIPPLPPLMGSTNRERVEEHTEVPGSNCAGCHALYINPFGFPFERYDAVGRVRADDHGFPIDARSTPYFGDASIEVADALALATALDQRAEVHACYAQHWIEFALGRPKQANDAGTQYRLGAASKSGASIKALIEGLVTSPAFFARSTEELP